MSVGRILLFARDRLWQSSDHSSRKDRKLQVEPAEQSLEHVRALVSGVAVKCVLKPLRRAGSACLQRVEDGHEYAALTGALRGLRAMADFPRDGNGPHFPLGPVVVRRDLRAYQPLPRPEPRIAEHVLVLLYVWVLRVPVDNLKEPPPGVERRTTVRLRVFAERRPAS